MQKQHRLRETLNSICCTQWDVFQFHQLQNCEPGIVKLNRVIRHVMQGLATLKGASILTRGTI